MLDSLSELHVLVILAGFGSSHRPFFLYQNLFSWIIAISSAFGSLSDPDLSLSDSVVIDVSVKLVVVQLVGELRAKLGFSVSHRRF